MKMAVMSDVHANPAALETALADARERGCDRFAMLGDITGYGYDVAGALKLVRDNFDVVLKGNHDSACAGLEPEWLVGQVPSYVLDVAQRGQLAAEDLEWLRNLPKAHAEECFAMVHAGFSQPGEWEYVLTAEDADRNFDCVCDTLIFCGHTHHAMTWSRTDGGKTVGRAVGRIRLREGRRYLVNAGSVGYPREDLCSTYAIYDSERRQIELRQLPFDFKGYIDEFMQRRQPLPDWLMELLEKCS